jgi:hypothetical protein
LKEFDSVRVFDNTDTVGGERPILVLETVDGQMVSLATQVPEWAVKALRGTAYEITPKLQRDVHIDPGGFGFGF